MGKSKIEWTDYTFNPWIGCTKVSEGCKYCYADRENKHYNWNPAGWGPQAARKRTSRHHDVEEFAAVAYLYGAWNSDLLKFQQKLEKGDLVRLDREGEKVAQQLTFASRGRVVSVDPDSLAGESVS